VLRGGGSAALRKIPIGRGRAVAEAPVDLRGLLTRDKLERAVEALTDLLRTREVQADPGIRRTIKTALLAVDDLWRLTC
jgi:hypothetical protein